MLPRKQSIFHLGEEGGAACHRRSLVGAAMSGDGSTARRGRDGLVVGLQILVHHEHHAGGHGHHHQQHGRHAHAANVVLKQMVRPLRSAAVSCSFLKSCSLCWRELSPNKDVFMYRGDQGFCSEECRGQQILVDEARERRGQPRHRSHQHTPIRNRPRKTLLAVA
ncbi:uncharacterized protein LOC124682447 [Lolium rigidum]|uniref:uncharacterized protein LOC124682447 n=1 Tax=Lolium rigidum TaxID=89674 RepID=UPI001F5CB0ED|nr:uncharacterized protein LOC124682447 [Lolium rigidum]